MNNYPIKPPARLPAPSPPSIAVLRAAAMLAGDGVVPQALLWPQPTCGRTVPCGRNDPCPCRSGRKFKKCHGSSR